MPDHDGDEARPELTALTPRTVHASDLARLPYMTGWFESILLAKLSYWKSMADAASA